MEVRAKNIGDSKFCRQPFASVEVASMIETVNKGSTVKFVAKTAILAEDWKLAFATKKCNHF